jgi:hypothetical protein
VVEHAAKLVQNADKTTKKANTDHSKSNIQPQFVQRGTMPDEW